FLQHLEASNVLFTKLIRSSKPEFHTKIAGLLKEGPALKEVITLMLQNPDKEKEILTKFKVKAMKNDKVKTFDFENESDSNDGYR
ncbi:17912_t:CDS:2, partial [Dentiscutata erythropus]